MKAIGADRDKEVVALARGVRLPVLLEERRNSRDVHGCRAACKEQEFGREGTEDEEEAFPSRGPTSETTSPLGTSKADARLRWLPSCDLMEPRRQLFSKSTLRWAWDPNA